MSSVQTAGRFVQPGSIKNSDISPVTAPRHRARPRRALPLSNAAAPYTADDRAALVARVICRIFDHSTDIPGEIEALLRAEFSEVARHA
jgi:hypothetical protein